MSLPGSFWKQGVGKSMELIQHMSKTIDDFRNFFRPDKEKVEFKVQEAITSTLITDRRQLQESANRG